MQRINQPNYERDQEETILPHPHPFLPPILTESSPTIKKL